VDGAHELDDRCGFPIVLYELEHAFPKYLATLPEPYRSLTLAEVIAAVSSPDVLAIVERMLTDPVPDSLYRESLAVREQLRSAFAETFRRDRIAALVYPTVPFAAPPIEDSTHTLHNGAEVDLFKTSVRNTSPGSVAGIPSISLPIGRTATGLPVGLSLEGPEGSDAALLSVARSVPWGGSGGGQVILS
jgi:mandelamide amidase